MNLLSLSPYIIITMSTAILILLFTIGNIIKRRDITDALSLIPVSYIVVFMWILDVNPTADISQPILRSVLMFSMGCSLYVLAYFLNCIKRGNGLWR